MNTDCAAVKTLWSWFPIITPQGDGSINVKPSKPVAEVSVEQAAKLLGCSGRSIYRLIDEGKLSCRKPCRKKTWIPVADIEAHRERTKDPEWWERN